MVVIATKGEKEMDVEQVLGLWKGLAELGNVQQKSTAHGVRLLIEQLAERDAALAGLLNAEHCPSCQNQGVIVIQTGGCDSDGENDTRCREREQCGWCYTTKNSFFNVLANLPESAKQAAKVIEAARKLTALEMRDDPHLSNLEWTDALQELCQAVREREGK